MNMVKTLNIGLRFLLELCLLVIFGYWGFNVGHNLLAKLLLGLGAPILVGIIWGMFLAPKSSMRLDMPWSLLVELLIWGLALVALFGVGKENLALVLGLVYILNKVLMLIWKQ
jgi:hypothetical protein